MTLAQLNALAPADQKIFIGWDGSLQEFDRNNALELHAYGLYSVGRIIAFDENKIEADLLAQPVREEK